MGSLYAEANPPGLLERLWRAISSAPAPARLPDWWDAYRAEEQQALRALHKIRGGPVKKLPKTSAFVAGFLTKLAQETDPQLLQNVQRYTTKPMLTAPPATAAAK